MSNIDITKQETLITRIKEMEDRYHDVTRVLSELDMAIEEYNDFKDELATLKDYMESGQWQKDFEADEAGMVPKELPREILSEDALYDLLSGADKTIAFAKESFK